MLDLLRQHPDGLSHVKIARTLGIEMGYLGGHGNYASQTILHQLVETGKVEKIGEKSECDIPAEMIIPIATGYAK